MPAPPNETDVEQGNPKEEDNLQNDELHVPLLGAGSSGYHLSTTSNPEEVHLEPPCADDAQPTSSTSAEENKDTTEEDPELHETRDVVGSLIKEGAEVALSQGERGRTPLLDEIKIRDRLQTLVRRIGPDVRDRDGKTVLRAAVDADWPLAVRVALDAGADVTIQAPDGETPLHAAVAGITDRNEITRKTMLQDILSFAEQTDAIDCLNANRETGLFYAVRSGYEWCVKQFLNKRASIKHTVKNNVNVFHIAAQNKDANILRTLLSFDKETTKLMINSRTPSFMGCAPIHFAVSNDDLLCVKVLKEYNADVCIETNDDSYGWQTPLHMAIEKFNKNIAEYILSSYDTHKFNNLQRSPIEQVNGKGLRPLHFAIQKENEDFIKLLLKYNANLAATTTENPKTALDMIMQHVTKPTKFLEDILDSYISFDGSMNRVKVDYQLLISHRGPKEEMEVIEALSKSGNEFQQKTLLLHPLIESFIYLQWWALWPFYLLIAAIYMVFVTLLATFATLVFYNIDTSSKPEWSYLLGGGSVIIFYIVFQFFQELSMNVDGSRYFFKPENFIKVGSLVLAAILPLVSLVQGWEEAARHVATAALLLASFQMLNIISQCPNWGYYVVMFKKVTCNVLKILGTFTILYIGFALSFMIQFRAQTPFDNVWHAFVKTLFLKTAEFDYNDVFHPDNKTDTDHVEAMKLEPDFEAVRVLYVIFLILVAIVLMNMMVGVAVDDIKDLKKHGNIGRLEKQVAFVRSLDTLKYNLTKVMLPVLYRRNLFPATIIFEKKTEKRKIFSNIREIPKRFQDAFFSIAQKNVDKDYEQTMTECKLQDKSSKVRKQELIYERMLQRLDAILKEVTKRDECASQIKEMNTKLDILMNECYNINNNLRSSAEKLDIILALHY